MGPNSPQQQQPAGLSAASQQVSHQQQLNQQQQQQLSQQLNQLSQQTGAGPQPGGPPAPPPPQAFFPHYPILPMPLPPPNYFNIGQHHHVQAPCVQPRRKNATRETTMLLKQWLNGHKRNPYPTKNEKIFLAVVTCMSLTQVSTWFANARRRLKKENKMTWSPRNRCDDDDDDDDDEENEDDENELDRDDDRMSQSTQEHDQDSGHIQPDAVSPLPTNPQHLNLAQQLQASQQQQQQSQQEQLQNIIQHNLHHNLQAHLQSHMLGQFQQQQQHHLHQHHQHHQHHLQQHQVGHIKLENPTNSNNHHHQRPASGEPAGKPGLWRPFM